MSLRLACSNNSQIYSAYLHFRLFMIAVASEAVSMWAILGPVLGVLVLVVLVVAMVVVRGA